MLLTIDVGNTNIVFSFYEGDVLAGSFRLRTDPKATADEIGIQATQYLNHFGLPTSGFEGAVIGSVVPQVVSALESAVSKYFGCQPVVVDRDVFPPLKSYAQEPLGTDRSTALIAARAKYGAPLIMLDFGTATTVDALDENGDYLGGVINTGLRTSMNALGAGAALLSSVELEMPDRVLGRNTVEQVQGGVVGSYIGGVEYLVRRTKAEMGLDPAIVKVVATGGLSHLIAAHTDVIDAIEPELVPEGLRLCFYLYQAEQKRN